MDDSSFSIRRYLNALLVPALALFTALVVGAILMWIFGDNPIDAYKGLFQGAFGSTRGWAVTIRKWSPLILTGLSVAVAFKAGLFNIGASGQFVMGTIFSVFVGINFAGLPMVIHLPMAILAGILGGMIWGAIPGALKVYTGAHEVIVTIMLNYIAINITDYLADGPWKDTSAGNIIARTPEIHETARIPAIAGIPLGFGLAILAAILVWWILSRTTLGFDIRTVGLNASAARYAGIRVGFTIILTMVLSGALAGIGGAVETQGVVGRYQPGFNAGLGFDGITIALLGKTSPFGVIPAAILVGAMRAGASNMQFTAGVAKEIVDVIQALMLFFVSADIVVRWIFRIKGPSEEEKITLSSGWGQQ